MKRTTKALIGAVFSVLAAGTAHATLSAGAIINIDFNSSTSTGNGSHGVGPTAVGAAEIGSAGDFWNGETNTTTTGTDSALKTAANAASGVTLNWNTDTTATLFGYNSSTSTSTANPLALMQDYIFSLQGPAGDTSATFSGLPAGTYNLFVYSQAPTGNRILGVSVVGASTYATQYAGGSSVNTATSFIPNTATGAASNGNFTEFTNISPNGSGTLAINYFASPSGEGDFNGIQLQLVPEPGSLGLMGLGGLLFLRRRRIHFPIGSDQPISESDMC